MFQRNRTYLPQVLFCALTPLICAPALNAAATGGLEMDSKPIVSDQPMTPDQLAVYRVVLIGWMGNGKGTHPVHLSIQTTPFRLDEMDADCGKSLHMVEGSVGEVHRFRSEDLPHLGPSKVELVDPEEQSKEVAENDPDRNIHKGKSIEDAVATGFAHGLVTLGEIHFDKDHAHAIVWYGFTCGRLCGNGATVILEKKSGVWGIKDRCSTWISWQLFDGMIRPNLETHTIPS